MLLMWFWYHIFQYNTIPGTVHQVQQYTIPGIPNRRNRKKKQFVSLLSFRFPPDKKQLRLDFSSDRTP